MLVCLFLYQVTALELGAHLLQSSLVQRLRHYFLFTDTDSQLIGSGHSLLLQHSSKFYNHTRNIIVQYYWASKLHPSFPFKHFFPLLSVFLFILTQELSYLMELVLEYRIICFQVAFCCSVICVKLTSGRNSIPATQLLHKNCNYHQFYQRD